MGAVRTKSKASKPTSSSSLVELRKIVVDHRMASSKPASDEMLDTRLKYCVLMLAFPAAAKRPTKERGIVVAR